ncbi:MAG: cation:proton antiporter [Deltaproteobacteria bacterium]|nr:cation:proton antiporter [Myxococcales bacterium]MDP3218418.1 cation:proton antiporter [Deltaproteobacteria bacterium]
MDVPKAPRGAGALFTAPVVLALVLLAAHLGGPAPFGASLLRLLVALAVVIGASRALGLAFAALHQPRVVGEMAAGILLGPVLLGRVAPGLSAQLLPAAVRPSLALVAQVSVLVYMFLVGVDFDAAHLRARTRASVVISNASIALPFALGFVLALLVRTTMGATASPPWVFALFMGVAMSVTAFPVLARVVEECRLNGTALGTLAMTCAAIGDATAWCLLAAVVSTARPDAQGIAAVLARLALYLVVAIAGMRPLARALAAAWERPHRASVLALPATLAMLAASAWATDAVGIHPIFGAFAAGLVVPADSRLARDLPGGMHAAVVLLMPAFFALAGLRMRADALGGGALGALLPVVIAVATVGKVGGSAAAARLTGLGWRDALALGALMNTRGLMELVVLQVGLDLGILPVGLYSVMVLMALATTLMTTPVVQWLLRGRGEAAAAG